MEEWHRGSDISDLFLIIILSVSCVYYERWYETVFGLAEKVDGSFPCLTNSLPFNMLDPPSLLSWGA